MLVNNEYNLLTFSNSQKWEVIKYNMDLSNKFYNNKKVENSYNTLLTFVKNNENDIWISFVLDVSTLKI